jgi:hypothetical protein
MPFIGYNPKVLKCYEELEDPIVDIPTTDASAWLYYKNENWIYNKLNIALSQNIDCGPIGVTPTKYPIIIKPIYNMFGGGIDARKINNSKELETYRHPGCLWMKWLEGIHLSHDIIVLNGNPIWSITFKGYPIGKGMFDYWEVITPPKLTILYIYDWIKKHLKNYTGCVCLETIGQEPVNIIEAHLRMGDIDRLGNYSLISNIISLYQDKIWKFKEEINEFYLFAIWGENKVQYTITEDIVHNICNNLTSYQIDDPKLYYQNPIGGVRLALLNDHNKNKCIQLRNRLTLYFNPSIPSYLREKLIS